MRFFVLILRLFLGLLFIFSALIKANDPLGLSYKIEEFFQAMHAPFLSVSGLILAILIICIEAVLGLAVFLGLWQRVFLRATLYVNLGFLALTSYAFFFAKIRACGCFGDCIPIDAQSSFYKDILLCLVNILLIFQAHKLRPWLSIHNGFRVLNIWALLVFTLCLFTYYRLPFMDCLAFKVGTNLREAMQDLASQNEVEVYFNYRKNGEIISFKSSDFPSDFDDSYIFVSREERQIENASSHLWSVKDFKLFNDQDQDFTDTILSQEQCVLLFIRNFDKTKSAEYIWQQVTKLQQSFPEQNLYVVVRRDLQALKQILTGSSAIPLYCDNTLMKTIARARFSFYSFKHGVIIAKKAL